MTKPADPAPQPGSDPNPAPDPTPAPEPKPADPAPQPGSDPNPAPEPKSSDLSDSQADFINELAQERFINKFLSENSEKYPDITLDDLKHVGDPGNVESEAKRLQDRLNAHAQQKLYEIENPAPARLSPEDIEQQERELAKNPGKDSFAKLIGLRLRRAK